MKVKQYMRERIFSVLPNRNSTQGYPVPAEGNPCTLQDPSITPVHPVIYGHSVQDTYTGKNLLHLKTSGQQTACGITITHNANGSINISAGTSTNTVPHNFVPTVYGGNKFKLNKTGTVTISMPESINGKIYLVISRFRDGKVTHFYTMDGSASFSVNETDEFAAYLQIGTKATLPEMTVHPQIELGTTATAYEPYVSSPTPDDPREIQSVGDKSVSLLDYSLITNYINSPVEKIVITDGCFDVQSKSQYTYNSIALPALKAGTTYTLWYQVEIYDRSAGEGNTVVMAKFEPQENINPQHSMKQNGEIWTYALTYTPAEDIDTSIFVATNYGSAVPAKARWQMMVLEGAYTLNTVPPYIPYNKYRVPVEIRGKNLAADKIISATRSLDGKLVAAVNNSALNSLIAVNPETTYSVKVHDSVYSTLRMYYYANGSESSFINTELIRTSSTLITFTTPANCHYWSFQSGGNGTLVGKEWMLVQGDQITRYEPYFNETVDLYLDAPLRKAGDAADFIDWEKGVVKRYVGVYTIPNTTTWTEWQAANGNGSRILFHPLKQTQGNTLGQFTCGSVIENINSVSTQDKQCSNTIYALEGYSIVYWYPDWKAMGLDGTEDKATANQKLQEWLAGIPIKQFTYVRATPSETPIELPKLPVKPHVTNIIGIDTAVKGDLEVKYHTFTKENENV